MRFLQIGQMEWTETLTLRTNDKGKPEDEWFFLPDTLTTVEELEAATLDMRVITYEDEEDEVEEEAAPTPTEGSADDASETDALDLLKKPKRPTHLTLAQFIGSMNAILVETEGGMRVIDAIQPYVQAYTIFYNKNIPESALPSWHQLYGFFPVEMGDRESLYDTLTHALFGGQYGDKMAVSEFRMQPTFREKVIRNSMSHLTVEGDFGNGDFRPVGSWSFNRVNFAGLNLEVWFEQETRGDIELQLRIRQMQEGSIDQIVSNRVYSQADLQDAIVLEETSNGQVICSLEARGQGSIDIGVLHVRWSRMGFGKFLTGGGIVSDAKKDEINYFFHPGDLKPPLCVYFSGFRSAEGFEGYWMMKNMKTPFLLISDQRMLGGSFYMGSEELEAKVRAVIQDKLDLLGFTNQDLIFSGLSMGTYGSLYYAADFNPRAVIIGKALANLGNMAVLNKTFSPGSFPTSLLVLRKLTGGLSEDHVQALQDRFWHKFITGDYKDTTFGIVYMKEDDYDPTAYPDIVSSLYGSQTQIIGKGLSGRHGDAADAAVGWFLTYYHHILERDFGRK